MHIFDASNGSTVARECLCFVVNGLHRHTPLLHHQTKTLFEFFPAHKLEVTRVGGKTQDCFGVIERTLVLNNVPVEILVRYAGLWREVLRTI